MFEAFTTEEVLARQAANPDLLLLDVRMEDEWEEIRIPGARLIPLPYLPTRVGELDPQQEVIVICAHGMRSQSAATFLVTQAGFARVGHLSGGMSAWTGPVEEGE